MRIISGKHKGRRIEFPKLGEAIRPTSDFAREAIFNILTHGAHGQNGHSFIGKRVLDLFCGTGAFGLEALSRGAESVTFIDQAREAISIAKHNAMRFNESDHAQFLVADATKLPLAKAPYSLIFLDPPYFGKLLGPTLKSLAAGGWIGEDAIIIIEHDAKEVIELPEGFEPLDQRRYGRAIIALLKQR